MIAVGAMLVVVAVSLLVTRIATVALVATGLSRESARFQARSSFTGTGFTTTEAESVVDHPVRRRIVMFLMLLGNAGIAVVVTSLVISFAGASGSGGGIRIGIVVGGLAALLAAARSAWVDRRLSRLIARALDRWTDLDTRDYAGLLDLAGPYAVFELQVEPDDWVAGRSLRELGLREEGVVVLGVYRDHDYIGAPAAPTVLRPDDVVVLYGRDERLCELDRRPAGAEGDRVHDAAVEEEEAAAADRDGARHPVG